MYKNNQDDVLMRTYMSSAKISFFMIAVVAIIEVIMLLVTVFNAPFYGAYLWRYRFFYITLLAVSVLYDILLIYIKNDIKNRFRILDLANPVCGFVFFIWAIGITYNDSLVTHTIDPTAYMTFSLAVPLCFYMSHMVYGLIALASDAVMLYLTFITSGSSSTLPNLIIFLAFQLILGISLLDIRRHFSVQIVQAEAQKTEIEELSGAQSQFFSSMSHEIRTPINSIIGLDEMILRENTSEVVNEDARHILSSSRLLLHLINDLLDMSRISAGMFEISEAPYKTKDMFLAVWSMLSIQAAQKDIKLIMDISPEIPMVVKGDAVRIEQILVNLVYNAIKYTNEGSVTLSVTCELKNVKDVLITYKITDTGIGIKDEYLPHIFTAYRRADNDVKQIEGSGLGLSIVKQFLDHMGGTIEVESVFGEGSTFTATIPQKVIDVTGVGEIDPFEEKSRYEVYKSRLYAPDICILVVDDTPENLFVARRLLMSTHIKVDTAQGGLQALAMTKENEYDVILLDHFMPEMDGIETFHAIKEQEDGKCRDSKFVMLTANVSKGSEKLYADVGFDAHMTKPVTAKDMEDVLFRLLGSDARIELIMHDGVETDRGRQDRDVPEALMRIFVSSIDETVRDLDRYLEEEDIANYTIKVHGLKSSARLVNETYISEQALKLEEAGKHGDIEAIRRAHPFFIKEYQECKKRLDVFSNDSSLCSDSELRDAYLAISEFARSEDYSGVMAILRSLEQYDLMGDDEIIIQKIKDAMEDMDYYAACNIIEKIL